MVKELGLGGVHTHTIITDNINITIARLKMNSSLTSSIIKAIKYWSISYEVNGEALQWNTEVDLDAFNSNASMAKPSPIWLVST